MGDRGREPDPGSATDQAEFRLRLHELMRWAGYRSLQQLEAGARRRSCTMPVSTANRALNADKLPTADFVERFVLACDGDPRRWLAARDVLVDRGYPRHPALRADGARERPDVCPYPGLAPFQADQAKWYFGRERAVAELLEALAERTGTGCPLFVVGPSGAGLRRVSDLVQHMGYVNAVAFSRDGRTLATTSTDATARLWDVADPLRPRGLAVLTGHSAPVHGLAFSPDGRGLATTSVDATARLWDVSDPGHPAVTAAPLAGHTDNVYSVAFGPDGHTLVTGSHDRTVRLWETDIGRIAERICGQRRRITPAEWQRYFPDVAHVSPCPQGGRRGFSGGDHG